MRLGGDGLQLRLVERHVRVGDRRAPEHVLRAERRPARVRAHADRVHAHAELLGGGGGLVRLHHACVRHAVRKKDGDLRLRLGVLEARERHGEAIADGGHLLVGVDRAAVRVVFRRRYLDALQHVQERLVVGRERRAAGGVAAERDEADQVVRARLHELGEHLLHHVQARLVVARALRREVERLHGAGHVHRHCDGNGIHVPLSVRERAARTRRRHHEQGSADEEQPRREVRRARAPASGLRGKAEHRRELDARAASPSQHPPGGEAERHRQQETKRPGEVHFEPPS